MKKKLLSLALAALLLLSLAVPAMAADSDFETDISEGGEYKNVLYAYHGSGGDVVIPDGIDVVGYGAFHGCTGLKSVAVPSGAYKIDSLAFDGCTNLKSVTVPSSVVYIGDMAFRSCPNLTDIYFGGTQEEWELMINYYPNMISLGFDGIYWIGLFDEGVNPTVHCNSSGPAASAMPTNDRLTVDGALQTPTVYKIGGSNFFKIRDLAAMLNGSEKQFDVGYDGALASVTLTTGRGYAKLDTDLVGAATGGNQAAAPSNDTIYINGQKIDVTVYKIGGSNYFKLRDLGKALGFYVGWTAADGMFIDTGKPYSE